MKIRHVFDLRHGAGELAQRLRHQPRLQAHLRFAHLAFDLGARHQRGHRVDDDDVDAVGADQHLDDLERLLAVVGLRHQQVVEIDAELLRVGGVERVLGVDEGRQAAGLLRLRDHLQRQRRLARRLRSVDLDHAAARHAADAQGVVDADRAGGDGLDRRDAALLAQAHDRAFAELLLDLADGQVEGLQAVFDVVAFRRHGAPNEFYERGWPTWPAKSTYSRNVPGESQAKVRCESDL